LTSIFKVFTKIDLIHQYLTKITPEYQSSTIKSLVSSGQLFGQENEDHEFIEVDIVPVYPNGGMPGFYQFINKNLEYPEEAKEQNIQGKVFVHFVVNDEGEIINEMAVKGINDQLDAEAVRIMKLSENSRSGLKSYIFTCH
jgi:hypothetical protein